MIQNNLPKGKTAVIWGFIIAFCAIIGAWKIIVALWNFIF